MSEEIIIDGVDVSGCEFFCNMSNGEPDTLCHCYKDMYGFDTNCKYNEAAKNCYYKQLKRLQEKYDTVVNKFFNSETDKTRLQAENEELKKRDKENLHYLACMTSQRNKLKLSLEEIREIMQENCNQCFEIDNFTKPDDCGICEWARVLKVIKELLDERN